MGKKKKKKPAVPTYGISTEHLRQWGTASKIEPPVQDVVNHPKHYTSDPSGVECITITRHRNFNVGNAIKYLWRNGLKDDPGQGAIDKQIEDLRKSVFYINDEIARLDKIRQSV